MKISISLVLTFILLAPCTADSTKNLLRFPGDPSFDNFIALRPDLSLVRGEFSVCTWLKNRLDQNVPWFSYKVPGARNTLILKLTRFHVMVASGVAYPLHFEAKIMRDEWYHLCYIWKSGWAEYYINGVVVPVTGPHPKGQLSVGGTLVLGQGQGRSESDKFAGDMYQLNVFRRTITMQEVTEMFYNGRCADICRALKYELVVSWADILRNGEVNGEVTKEANECDYAWGVVSDVAKMLVRNIKRKYD